MSLWTDSSCPSVSDLISYDGGILEVATVEGLNLSEKLQLAHNEISSELVAHLLRTSQSSGKVPDLSDVVVTEPLKRWTAFHGLALAFRDAHFRHLSERYKGKWTEYDRLAQRARDSLFLTGIGKATHSIPRAAAP